MKRRGHLFERIVTFDNLLLAARKALRGKKHRPTAAAMYFRLEPELLQLQRDLESGLYVPRPYRTFMVFEPKPHCICAADIRDRVVHHAICNVLEPLFEGFAIADSYACRRGKGTHRALARAQEFARHWSYFLKLDVRQFFPSVDHGRLKALLRRRLKDARLLGLLDRIIDHPMPGGLPGRGLPIGNLTSQYLANFYLGHLDHHVKDELGLKGYLRYMDDILLFAPGKPELHQVRAAVADFLGGELGLALKEDACFLGPVTQGIPFLGMRVFPGLIRLQHAGLVRCVRRQRQRAFAGGRLDERGLVQSAQSLIGHLRHASTLQLRRALLRRTAAMEG